ncbi:TIGR01777 family oxidoreductase [Kutzneria viridogrisea]|uniref:Epimerase family protein n=2 Tax=Kutzneria TaxID=43356 RepID=W5WAS3_9PSEU|nr:TIGR01777 family oxidoreductase [Kutzneria albida]AHH95309.1 epimerase family protein [Kutzneria albida DSM 43870]MBA8927334.1 hypothetical protein [Kutzneria viridogrisea]
MRVVIAGSSGLIGTALVLALRQAGHEVVRLVRRRPNAPDERFWDPPAGELAEGALDGADAVVNLCGTGIADKRWSQARKQALLDSRTEPTEVLAAAVLEHGVPVLVSGSAVGYYGDCGARVVDESSPSGKGFLAELCREWEAAASPAAQNRLVLLRTGLVLSESGGLLGKLRPLFSLLLGGKLGDGRQYMPWISLDDHVAAIRFALEHEQISGPLNLTGPTPVSNAEFTRELGAALGRPAPWAVPGFAMRAVLGELADEALLSGQRAVPAALLAQGFTFQHETLATALAEVVGAQA